MDQNLRAILQQLEAEKSIDRDTLLEAIRSAIESAARKSMNRAGDVTVDVDPDTLAFKVFEIRTVVETIQDESLEIDLEAALQLNPAVVVGNRLKVPAEPKDFGRIAAQTARQVIIQKIKDAERDRIYDEFKEREGDLITGTVKRNHHGNIVVTVGRAEAVVPYREQSPREDFKPGDRIRAYLLEVEKGPRGTGVILSRTSSELVRGLFEQEVPELYDGTVEIRAISREPGSRTKVAVYSNDANVDAVGACVGMKGSRVRAVVEELSGEKIDIVRWSENPMELCANALNPADILRLEIDEAHGSIRVTVPQDQLSLAIGKRGQNARLASKLIGWNIDIHGEGDPEPEAVAIAEDTEADVAVAVGEETMPDGAVDEAAVEPQDREDDKTPDSVASDEVADPEPVVEPIADSEPESVEIDVDDAKADTP